MDQDKIINGQTSLGIELGSTRIKAVLIDFDGTTLATGSHTWENTLNNNLWSYSETEIWDGIKACYHELKAEVQNKYGITIKKVGAIGISGMMHGMLALDKHGNLLTPFRTWRNTNATPAATKLTELFDFNIPIRWTIAHVYQCILDKEIFLPEVDFATTLSSYVHYKLTGNRVLGIGDASGIFPIDPDTQKYDQEMVRRFEQLPEVKELKINLNHILPEVLCAGSECGQLTRAGALLIDPSGDLESGIPLCPPEGDAGTGMVATNSIEVHTGNISAGTSTFAMFVLEKNLSKLYHEIDMVTTPDGHPVAMVHANSGTSDINAWIALFKEFANLLGQNISEGELFTKLYEHSLTGDEDAGDLLTYGFYSGESLVKLENGLPLFARTITSKLNLANFIRSHIYGAIAIVRIGMDVLKQEKVQISHMNAHGGLFKTKGVAQKYLAAALELPVSVMANAGEGGAWGQAVLASYLLNSATQDLPTYLNNHIFKNNETYTMEPTTEAIRGYAKYLNKYRKGLKIETVATDLLNE